ncbi:chromosome segregation protein Spc25-domain-containing protein [Gongronella butleri]|nr:chromosome segregation protein Spc25-domain-containing protein [Gongronella butleri]
MASSSSWVPPPLHLDLEATQRMLADKRYELDDFIQQVNDEHDNSVQETRLQIEAKQAENDALRQEIKETKESIAYYESQLPQAKEQRSALEEDERILRERRDALEKQYDEALKTTQQLQKVINDMEQEAQANERQASSQQKRNRPELAASIKYTGLSLEPLGGDRIKFNYRLVDKNDPDRVFSVTIDVSDSRFQVPHCDPMIPNLAQLAQDLSDQGNIRLFTIKMRQAFCQLVSP